MHRNLVLCVDGTWNTKGEYKDTNSCPSNVARVSELLVNDGKFQTVQYLSGVGTSGLIDSLVGGIYGAGITELIEEGYKWLCENYQPGDRISFFGFSRGAFAVRSIIGVIAHAGILETMHVDRERIKKAITLYRYASVLGNNPSIEFKKTFSHNIKPHVIFIGVWDTVARYGPLLWPVRRVIQKLFKQRFSLYDGYLPFFVRSAYHALALDEVREAFLPHRMSMHPEYKHIGQVIEEVWFCGGHSDVGGGYCKDNQAAEIPLAWIVEKAIQSELQFKSIPSASDESYFARLHDESMRNLAWRLLPKEHRDIQDGDSFDESVFLRMNKTSYNPKANGHYPNSR